MAMPKTIIDCTRNPCFYKKLPAAALGVLLLTIGIGVQGRAEGLGRLNKSEKTAVQMPALLWKDPTNISVRNLRYGQGGERHSPHSTVFSFVKEDLSGTNPKFIVTDQSGVKWKIKLGAEAKPEVAASRLVWAVGILHSGGLLFAGAASHRNAHPTASGQAIRFCGGDHAGGASAANGH
jgi:hypothetical protein